MKKIFAIVAVSSLAVTAAHAQSSGIPSFSSETEKKAWIEANPEKYQQILEQNERSFTPAKNVVTPAAIEKSQGNSLSRREAQSGQPARATYIGEQNKEVFESDAAKEEWLRKNAEPKKD
jgi:hypothetical protein